MFTLGEKMEFLIGSPFSTPVGQRIERATSGVLQTEDWGLNMEICDIVNETDEGPKDAVKAIKKKIVGNKNFREIMLALTVLETCVKNCGHRFHVLIASQEFIEGVLVRSILPKYNPPSSLHDRVLSLIQAWADAFRSSPSLAGVVCVYDDLRRRGLEFPMTDLDALSPIHTPNRSTPDNGCSDTVAVTASQPQPQPHAPPLAPAPTQRADPPAQSSEGPVSISPAQSQKLRAELALVRGNLTVMSEMLTQMTPGQSQQEDSELLQKLYLVCKSMQSRVVELIPKLMDESLTEELLIVNDDLNNAFLRYDRFERQNKAQRTAVEQQRPAVSSSLIDLSTLPQTLSQPAHIQTTNLPAASTQSNQRKDTKHSVAEEEFDMFAQTRGSSLAEQRKSVRYEDPGAVEGLAGALDTRLQVTGISSSKNSTVDEIDRWLSPDTEDGPAVSEGVTSEEFDQFLEDRVRVVDNSGSTGRNTLPSTSRPPSQSVRKQEQTHDNLFSL
ncbi:target of Myb1 membrane trafficking protein [Aplochiton taeniatus]